MSSHLPLSNRTRHQRAIRSTRNLEQLKSRLTSIRHPSLRSRSRYIRYTWFSIKAPAIGMGHHPMVQERPPGGRMLSDADHFRYRDRRFLSKHSNHPPVLSQNGIQSDYVQSATHFYNTSCKALCSAVFGAERASCHRRRASAWHLVRLRTILGKRI